MLTDEQMRNGLINPASLWPNKIVPFDIDDVFSEYCSTKLLSGKRGVEETYQCIMFIAIAPVPTTDWLDKVMAIVIYPCPTKISHTHTRSYEKPAM
jgi:hypothetical protein